MNKLVKIVELPPGVSPSDISHCDIFEIWEGDGARLVTFFFNKWEAEDFLDQSEAA